MLSVLHADCDGNQCERQVADLASRGYHIRTAANGLDCLEKLRQATPDLLILDLHLPWGGSEGVLAVMRAEPALRRVPVVIITANQSSIQTLNKIASPPVVRALARPFSLLALLEEFVDNGFSGIDNPVIGLEKQISMSTRVHGLRVDNRGGSLVVHGRVRSYYAKQLVLTAAMNHLAGTGIDVCFDVAVD